MTLFTDSLIGVVALLIIIGLYLGRSRGWLGSTNLLSPGQIVRRRKNLDKILALAQKRSRITVIDVRRDLKFSEADTLRYLEYLVNLNKLLRVNERGQAAFYQLPKSY